MRIKVSGTGLAAELDWSESWELAEGATVHDLLRSLSAKYPDFRNSLAFPNFVTFALNDALVSDYATELHDGDEVLLITVVDGG
jgi:molybdopterin converting factor small subunit